MSAVRRGPSAVEEVLERLLWCDPCRPTRPGRCRGRRRRSGTCGRACRRSHRRRCGTARRGAGRRCGRRRPGRRCGRPPPTSSASAGRRWSCPSAAPASRSRPRSRGSAGHPAAPTAPARCGPGRSRGSQRGARRPPATPCTPRSPDAATAAGSCHNATATDARTGTTAPGHADADPTTIPSSVNDTDSTDAPGSAQNTVECSSDAHVRLPTFDGLDNPEPRQTARARPCPTHPEPAHRYRNTETAANRLIHTHKNPRTSTYVRHFSVTSAGTNEVETVVAQTIRDQEPSSLGAATSDSVRGLHPERECPNGGHFTRAAPSRCGDFRTLVA